MFASVSQMIILSPYIYEETVDALFFNERAREKDHCEQVNPVSTLARRIGLPRLGGFYQKTFPIHAMIVNYI